MTRKKSAPPDDTYPLKLTQPQRETIVYATRLRPAIKQKMEQVGEATQTISFSRNELDALDKELSEAARFAPGPAQRKHLIAVQRKATTLLEAMEDKRLMAGVPAPRKHRPDNQADLLFQFKISLLDIKPLIWRRIQVPDGTLEDLHHYIQAVFGWDGGHLHQFIIDGVYYGPPPLDEVDLGPEVEDESQFVLSKLIPKSQSRARWLYEYDFGDDWRHEIRLEGYPAPEAGQNYPRCVAGARAGPPEDSGGPWGYADYLEALADPENERHDELLEWGGPFDPEAFDVTQATKKMRRMR